MDVIDQAIGTRYAMYRGDCIEVIKGIPDNSIHYTIFSPPFQSLYVYSNSDRDLGNTKTDEEFAEHFSYLVPELLRVTMPGRLLSFHCMNLPSSKERDGVIGLKDFRGELIRMFCGNEAAILHDARKILERLERDTTEIDMALTDASLRNGGWIYHSEVCIWKDPVTAMHRTKALGLLHKQIKKDSCMSRQGIADFLVTMRKPGENPERVAHPHGLVNYFGEETPVASIEDVYRDAEVLEIPEERVAEYNANYRSVQIWQRYASPVWMDINPSRTLQRLSVREDKDERHICPLQLQVIKRALELWTNPGDVVFSPFAGIGSEGYCALKMDRRFIGIELKESYWRQAVSNLNVASETTQTDMFSEIESDELEYEAEP